MMIMSTETNQTNMEKKITLKPNKMTSRMSVCVLVWNKKAVTKLTVTVAMMTMKLIMGLKLMMKPKRQIIILYHQQKRNGCLTADHLVFNMALHTSEPGNCSLKVYASANLTHLIFLFLLSLDHISNQ